MDVEILDDKSSMDVRVVEQVIESSHDEQDEVEGRLHPSRRIMGSLRMSIGNVEVGGGWKSKTAPLILEIMGNGRK